MFELLYPIFIWLYLFMTTAHISKYFNCNLSLQCIVPKAILTVKKCSWKWANLLPETCRADWRRLINEKSCCILLVAYIVVLVMHGHTDVRFMDIRVYIFHNEVDASANSKMQTVWELRYRLELTSCSIVLLEKLLVAQLIKNSPNSAKSEG